MGGGAGVGWQGWVDPRQGAQDDDGMRPALPSPRPHPCPATLPLQVGSDVTQDRYMYAPLDAARCHAPREAGSGRVAVR